jgi:DNA-directed RNA polymerase subunit omega
MENRKTVKKTENQKWRRGRDSNPRYGLKPYGDLANRCFRPLSHLSAAGRETSGFHVVAQEKFRDFVCFPAEKPYQCGSFLRYLHMNPELVKQAQEKVGNSNILINVVSRRVRQLNSGNRPMLVVSPTLGAADIALTEIVEGKLAWDASALDEAENAHKGGRRRRSS